MNVETLLDDFTARGIFVSVRGDSIHLDAPAKSLTETDLLNVQTIKPEIVRLHRLASGLPADDSKARLLDVEFYDPADLPTCLSCGRLMDIQTLDDKWHCSHCDPNAERRRKHTEKWLGNAYKVRYIHDSNG